MSKLPTKPTVDEDGDPLPWEDGKGNVYMPMSGKYNMACMDALLRSYSEPSPKSKRKRKSV
jgi:hypothetical protein